MAARHFPDRVSPYMCARGDFYGGWALRLVPDIPIVGSIAHASCLGNLIAQHESCGSWTSILTCVRYT